MSRLSLVLGRNFLLCLVFLGGQMLAADFPPLEKTTSPDQRFAVVLAGSGRVSIKDLKTNREVGLVAEGGAIAIYHGVVRWSPDGSKVAIEIGHHKWNDTSIFVRKDGGFREVHFTRPDALAMYAAHPPPNHPREYRKLFSEDTVGEWLNNSEISLTTSYGVDGRDDPDSNHNYTIAAAYVLQITDGRPKVKDAKLKVTP